jgi:hypothetical protein
MNKSITQLVLLAVVLIIMMVSGAMIDTGRGAGRASAPQATYSAQKELLASTGVSGRNAESYIDRQVGCTNSAHRKQDAATTCATVVKAVYISGSGLRSE